jgi:2-oxoglutarate dehydrogenase E2 component (dihydrolipoamide succinyltransferase)
MPIQIVVPEIGESIVEATVGSWLKREGDLVAAGEALLELETEKVNLEVYAERAGRLARIERQAGEDVKVGDVLGVIEEVEGAQAAAQPAKEAPEAPPPSAAGAAPAPPTGAEPTPAPAEEKRRATPVAKRLAEEKGVDLAQVSPSGPGGRATKRDVQSYVARQQTEQAPAVAMPPAPRPVPALRPVPAQEGGPVPDRHLREEHARMSRRRQTIARRLIEAQQTAAMLTTFNEVDMSAVAEVRKRRKDAFAERHGVSLGLMSFFVKATIGALKAFPQLNAEIQGDEIVFKHYYDIGIAVGAAEGLVVPVLRDADRMAFAEVERTVKDFVQKAQDGTLSLEDLRGGTFTITNGGVFGSLLSTPILNPPQVGILGLHKIEERPVALRGEVVIRPMMYVALTYDHRIVDGREAVQFLVRFKELIEDPESLLLEG